MPIIWESINFSSRSVLANVKFSPKRADRNNRSDFATIKYSASLNLCWRRFVILKEMFHCLLDTGTDLRVSNTDDLKTLSQGLVSGAVGAVAGFAPYHTEKYAAFLAMETLFPMRRENLMQRVLLLAWSRSSNWQSAIEFQFGTRTRLCSLHT